MPNDPIKPWIHDHTFGEDEKKPGEVRTILVIVITMVTMILEITAGIAFGSMALLADGLHMASHATALSIALFAYIFARRHARDGRFSFGTGKVNSLAGFSGAILLALFSLMMAFESVGRLVSPVEIAFDPALVVAVVGLIVNGVCVLILGQGNQEAHHTHDHDHNLRSAYLHVLADALTSLLAIFALLAGKYFGLNWMDPIMGLIGAGLVARWSIGLLYSTGAVLVDRQGPKQHLETIRASIEDDEDNRVVDLHVWPIGPNRYAMILSLTTSSPKRPDHYRRLLPSTPPLSHVSVEIWPIEPKRSGGT